MGIGRRIAAVIVISALGAALGSSAAVATSCVPHENATPRAIVEGTDRLATNETFRDRFDGAVFGTVVATDTNEEPGVDHGRTEVLVELTGWLGRELTSPALIIEPDPGWMNGYGLQVGRHYFIPFVSAPDGLRSHVCDPISELPADEVPDLIAAVNPDVWGDDAGTLDGASEPGATAPNDPTEAVSDPGVAPDRRWAWPLIIAVAGAGLAAPLAVRARRRNDRQDATRPL